MKSWPGLGPRACASTCPLKARLCFHLQSAAHFVTTPREIWGTGGQKQLRGMEEG